MADTLADMKVRIASEIARGASATWTAQIAAAINDAIAIYAKERFRFSETKPSAPPTFNTVVGRAIYTSADNANIGSLFKIDYVEILIGNTLQKLLQMMPEEATLYNNTNTMAGQPSWWAYQGNELILSGVPSSVWPITLGLFLNVAAPVDDAEAGNPWMQAANAERLIRARAKYELAVHVMRNPTMAQAMSPDPPAQNGGVVGAAYRERITLKGEGNRVVATGRIRPMRF